MVDRVLDCLVELVTRFAGSLSSPACEENLDVIFRVSNSHGQFLSAHDPV